jgi:hypothetical protein
MCRKKARQHRVRKGHCSRTAGLALARSGVVRLPYSTKPKVGITHGANGYRTQFQLI